MLHSALGRFDNLSKEDFGWTARCPNHPDSELEAVMFGPEGKFQSCTGGCTIAQVLEALDASAPTTNGHEPEWLTRGPPVEGTQRAPLVAEPLDVFLARIFPPVEWLIPTLLPAHSVTVLMSGPNVGKTFLGIDFAFQAAAAGKRVLLVEMEGAGSAFQERLRRAREAAGGAPLAGEVRVIFRPLGFSLLHKADLDALVAEASGIDLVVLDSLSALAGDVDENDSKEMRRLAEALELLKNATGSAVLALHHMTKEAWAPGEKPTLRNMRGHGVLPGRADAALALVPQDAHAGLLRFELHVVKQRDDQKALPKIVEIIMTGDAAVVEMRDLDEVAEAAPRKRGGGMDAIVERLLSSVLVPVSAQGAKAGGPLLSELKIGRTEGFKALRTLVANEQFGCISEKPFKRYWRLTE